MSTVQGWLLRFYCAIYVYPTLHSLDTFGDRRIGLANLAVSQYHYGHSRQ